MSIKSQVNAQSCLKRCGHNCLRCSDNTGDCIACAFNQFSLSEPVKTSGNMANSFFKGFLSLIMGKALLGPHMKMTEIHISSKCVSECPKTYHDKVVRTDYVNRRCV